MIKKLLSIILIVCGSLQILYANVEKCTNCPLVIDQLVQLNMYWKQNKVDNLILNERICFERHNDLIQLHLQLVESHLRQKEMSTLSSSQRSKREQGLDILNDYWQQKQFPINNHHKGEIVPYFIDDYNTACAVGQMVRETGHEAFAEKVRQENNYAYIEDMNFLELQNWAKEFGFDEMELRWIQPAYSCSFNRTDIVVTNTNNSGIGSFVWAVNEANNDPLPNSVKFDLPAGTVIYLTEQIWLTGDCDAISGYMVGSQDNIIIDGSNFPLDNWGIVINCIDCDFLDMEMRNFSNTAVGAWEKDHISFQNNILYANKIGIQLAAGTNNISILNNIIGIDENMNNNQPIGSEEFGLFVNDASWVTISSNTISGIAGNEHYGIFLDNDDIGSNFNISNNKIGVDEWGNFVIPNHYGVYVGNTKSNIQIHGNTISGNEDSGILVEGANNVEIYSNLIGWDDSGQIPMPHDTTGIWLKDVNNIQIYNNQICGNNQSTWGVYCIDSENINFGTLQENEANEISNCNVGITYNNIANAPIQINSFSCNQFPIWFENQPNELNAPIITSATTDQIQGTATSNSVVYIYAHQNSDCPNITCQGKSYIGDVLTNTAGIWIYSGNNIPANGFITAMINKNGDVSGFSDCFTIEQGGNNDCATPNSPITEELGHSYLLVNWQHDTQNCENLGYEKRWRETGGSWSSYYDTGGSYPELDFRGLCGCPITLEVPPPHSAIALTQLKPCTDYELQIRWVSYELDNNNSIVIIEEGDWSSIYNISTLSCNNDYFTANCYSVPAEPPCIFMNALFLDNEIIPVFGGNTGDCHADFGDMGYDKYEDLEINLSKGTSHELGYYVENFDPNSPNGFGVDFRVKIWIDFNQDGDFGDADELLYNEVNSPVPNFSTQFFANLAIPNAAFSGETTMRISFIQEDVWNNVIENPSSCENFSSGHVKDFEVSIIENNFIPSDEVLCLDWVINLFNNDIMDYLPNGNIFIFFDENTQTVMFASRFDPFNDEWEIYFFDTDGNEQNHCFYNINNTPVCDNNWIAIFENREQLWVYEEGMLPNCCNDSSNGILCADWIQQTISQSLSNNCNYPGTQSIQTADWFGETVVILSGSEFPLGAFADYYDCSGNLIQSCSGFPVIVGCTPDPPIIDEDDLTNITVVWSCIEGLPDCSNDCPTEPNEILCSDWLYNEIQNLNCTDCPFGSGFGVTNQIYLASLNNQDGIVIRTQCDLNYLHRRFYSCNGDLLYDCFEANLQVCSSWNDDIEIGELIWDCSQSSPNCSAFFNVNANIDIEVEVQNMFNGGNCIEINNFQQIGADDAIGTFNSSSFLGIENGLVISTGNVSEIENASDIELGTNHNLAGDASVSAIVAGLSTNDAAGFEFDFVPSISEFQLNLVFASEEYCEFSSNSFFHDGFGIFLSGAGISNEINLATLPNTANPICALNINPDTNASYFISNSESECGLSAIQPEIFGFNGFTTPFTFDLSLIPNENYHLKIVIADASDHINDSGIFINTNFENDNCVASCPTDPDEILCFDWLEPIMQELKNNCVIGCNFNESSIETMQDFNGNQFIGVRNNLTCQGEFEYTVYDCQGNEVTNCTSSYLITALDCDYDIQNEYTLFNTLWICSHPIPDCEEDCNYQIEVNLECHPPYFENNEYIYELTAEVSGSAYDNLQWSSATVSFEDESNVTTVASFPADMVVPTVHTVCVSVESDDCAFTVCETVTVPSIEPSISISVNNLNEVEIYTGSPNWQLELIYPDFGNGGFELPNSPDIHTITYSEDGIYEVCVQLFTENQCIEYFYCETIEIDAIVECELFPSFEIELVQISNDNSGEKFYDFINTSLPPYDSVVWWIPQHSPISGDQVTVPIWSEYEPLEEEVCLWLFDSTTGCDTMYCEVFTFPCTNYASLELEVEGSEVAVSLNCDCSITEFNVDYGNGFSEVGPFNNFPTTLTYTYSQTGLYEVCVTLTDAWNNNCSETLCDSVYIEVVDENYELTADKLCVEPNENIIFDYTASPLGNTNELILGDGTIIPINNSQGTYTYSYDVAGVYQVSLRVDGEIKDFVRIQVKSCGWVSLERDFGNSSLYYEEDICDVITGDGRYYFNENLLNGGANYPTLRNIRDFNICGDEVILEARIKVPVDEGGFLCYDPALYIYGSESNAHIRFMDEGNFGTTPCAHWSSTGAGTTVISDDLVLGQSLTGDFSDWVILKMEISNDTLKTYLDNELRFQFKYEGEVGQVKGLGYITKGAGSMDWIRLYHSNGNLAYEEEFESCDIANQDEACEDFAFDCDNITSNGNLKLKTLNIQILPNPSSGIFTFKADLPKIYQNTVEIINAIGQNVDYFSLSEQSINLPIDLSKYPDGVYFVRLSNSDFQITKKVVLRK